MKVLLSTVTASLTWALSATAVSALLLYDGLSSPFQTPSQQNWLYQATAIATIPKATATSSGTVLDTGNSANYAGYFNQNPIILDRDTGYTVSFRLRVSSESHSTNDRAGFSVIVMSKQRTDESQPYGVELGFWLNSIWTQSSDFTRVATETATYNTQSLAHTYHLRVSGDQYQLFVDDATTPILTGPLRQYTGYTPPAGYPNPYKTPNLIFWGDNTTSAKSKVTLMRVEAN